MERRGNIKKTPFPMEQNDDSQLKIQRKYTSPYEN